MADTIVDARAAALTGLFDDASTSPPDRREPDEALSAHLDHRAGDHGWMIGHFLLGADQTDPVALGQVLVARPGITVPLGVVLPRSRVGGIPPTLPADLARMAVLSGMPQVALEVVDVVLQGHDPAGEIEGVLEAMTTAGLGQDVSVACEIGVAGRSPGEVLRRIGAVARARGAGRELLAKLRLAGTMPGTAPTVVEVAGFLQACTDAEVGVKTTAGAVHAGVPDRREDEPAYAFLNLLGAAATAYRGGSLAEITALLTEPVARVRLGPGALIIGDAVLESELLADTRHDLLRTVACPDLNGPLGDLVALGALEAGGARP